MRCVSLLLFGCFIPSALAAQIQRIGEDPRAGSSAAVVVPGELPLVHTTQLLPVDKNGDVIGKDDAAAQSAFVLQQLKDVLRLYNLPLEKVVKLNLVAKNLPALETLQKTLAAACGEHPPAGSVVVSDLSHPEALVGLDAIAALPEGTRYRVGFYKVPELPQADHHLGILPAGQRIYIAGQAEPGELLVATQKTMESLAKTLESMNLTKAAIVQIKAFVNPMSRADEVRREFAKFFDMEKLPLPPVVFIDWRFESPIEIEVIAWGGEARPGEPLDFITPSFMKSSPVFSRVVRVNNGPLIYFGGLHGSAGTTPDEQITSIFEQMNKTLKAADSDFRHLAKGTYYCTEPTTIKRFGALRPNYYNPQRPPAASLSLVSSTGRTGTTITLDMLAVPKPKDLTPRLPETNGSVMIDAQEWPLKPGPRQVQVYLHYPERNRLASVNPETGIMLSLHNWGGSYNVGTADPNSLAQRYNVIAVCVDYLQSGAQASIRDPEPYDFGYLQGLDALRALHFVMSELKAKNIPFDAGRIYTTGGSGGGNVSLMANKLAPRTFAAVIELCGMPKLTDIVAYNLPGSGGLDARYNKDPASPNYLSPDAQELRFVGHPEHSRLMKTWKASSKVLVVHGVDDKLFLAEVREMVENMRAAELDVEPLFVTKDQVDGKSFTTTGHALGNRTLIVQQVADKYLLPTSKDLLRRTTPTDFDRRDQVVRYPTPNGVWVISYEEAYPVGRFEPSR